MKKVFSNSDECIHVFAQRTQSEGRASNVFFCGDKIYSYGYHYLLAEFITVNGNLAIVINDSGYSNTTAKHISAVRQGTRQYRQFFVTETNPKRVFNQLESLADKLSRARKPEFYISQAETLFKKYNEFIAWSGKTADEGTTAKINILIEVFRGKKYSDYLVEKAEAIKQAEANRQKALKKQLNKELKEFFAYKRTRLNVNLDEDYCRVSLDGNSIETTQNVKVSIESARKLYSLIKAKKDIKGFNIDGYTVISINGTLKIGCHKINTKNVTKIGGAILTC